MPRSERAAILGAEGPRHARVTDAALAATFHRHQGPGKATGRMGGRMVGSMLIFVGLLVRLLLDPKKRQNFKMLTKLEAMTEFKNLIESGKLTPVVGRTFALSEVRSAMRCMEDGSVLGRIIVTP